MKLSNLFENQDNKFAPKLMGTSDSDLLDYYERQESVARYNYSFISQKFQDLHYKKIMRKRADVITFNNHDTPPEYETIPRWGIINTKLYPEWVEKVKRMAARYEILVKRSERLNRLARKLRKKVIADHIKTKQQRPAKTMPTKDIPKIIKSGAARAKGFDNPYYTYPSEQYAGSPAHYKHLGSMIKPFVTINKALERNGVPEFNVIYAGTRTGGGPAFHRYSNFIMIGANGRLIWRKHDPGAVGSNMLYLDGQKITIPRFVDAPKFEQDRFLAPLKEPKK